MGRTQHGGQIPSQFNLKRALLAARLGLDSTTAADDVRLQGAFGGREDDGVDEGPNGLRGFGAGSDKAGSSGFRSHRPDNAELNQRVKTTDNSDEATYGRSLTY